MYKIWLIQHVSSLELVGVTSKNLFHEKCQNTGVNGEWMVAYQSAGQIIIAASSTQPRSNGPVVQLD